MTSRTTGRLRTLFAVAVSLTVALPSQATGLPPQDGAPYGQWAEELELETNGEIANSDGYAFNNAEVNSIAAELRVEEDVARAYMSMSDIAPAANEAGARLLPATFAGAWLDPTNPGSAMVAFTEAPAQQWIALQADLPPSPHWERFIPIEVEFSGDDLSEARGAIEARLPLLRGLGLTAVYTDTPTNRVLVGLETLTPSKVRTIRRMAGRVSDRLTFGEVSGMTLTAIPAPSNQCVVLFERCNPLRGNTSWTELNGHDPCGIGFYAESPAGLRTLLTAGHCPNSTMFHGGERAATFSFEADRGKLKREADGQRHHVVDGWARSNFLIHRSDSGFVDQDYRITRRYLSRPEDLAFGTYICTGTQAGARLLDRPDHAGATTCGPVIASDAMILAFNPDGSFAFVLDPAFATIGAATPGDSGGPMYASNRAYGLLSPGCSLGVA